MANVVVGYLLVAGGMRAGLQVLRGAVRGTGRLIEGDVRGAVSEVAAGVLAPVVGVYQEVGKLVGDTIVAAQGLTDDGEANLLAPDGAPSQRNGVTC
jgi:hypothetical protein